MFVALNTAGERVCLESHAQAATLKGQDFVCPACRQPVRIKNGDVVIAHFAHVGTPCEVDSESESPTHLQGKMWLRQLGMRLGYQVELEVFYPEIKQRADVVWHTDRRTIVIEFQCSDLPSRRLMTRTAGYHRLGLDCIWVLGPRHHAKVIGSLQERFLQRGVDGHLHLWFADGESWLEDWQWHPEHYQITHYTMQQTTIRTVGLVQSRARFAQQLGNGLHFRTPQVMALADTVYKAGHALGGVPWLASDDLSHVPGLPLPEWQLRTYWLLTFEEQEISREQWHISRPSRGIKVSSTTDFMVAQF